MYRNRIELDGDCPCKLLHCLCCAAKILSFEISKNGSFQTQEKNLQQLNNQPPHRRKQNQPKEFYRKAVRRSQRIQNQKQNQSKLFYRKGVRRSQRIRHRLQRNNIIQSTKITFS